MGHTSPLSGKGLVAGCCLFAAVVILSAAASKVEESLGGGGQLPPYWDQAVLLGALPRDKSTNATVIDPWVYSERLGAMKTLILETTHASPCLFENDVNNNILWGLALQFG